MIKKNMQLIFITIGLLTTANSTMADQCTLAPHTNYTDDKHTRIRDGGLAYVSKGNTSNVRVDTQSASINNVYFFLNNTYKGHDKSNFFNGHASKRIKFEQLGRHTVTVSQDPDVNSIPIPIYSCDAGNADICRNICAGQSPDIQANWACSVDYAYQNSQETSCAYRNYSVHGRPSLSTNSAAIVNNSNGSIGFNVSVKGIWAEFSAAKDQNRPITISWYQQNECRHYKWGQCAYKLPEEERIGSTSNNQSKILSFPNRDPRTIKAVLSDGVNRVQAHFQVGDFPEGSVDEF